MSNHRLIVAVVFPLLNVLAHSGSAAEFESVVKPLLNRHCLVCHGGDEVNGKVDFKTVATSRRFLGQPELIQELIEVIDANDMPPEGEPPLAPLDRTNLLAALKNALREATAGQEAARVPIRRLNRFQYNNVIKDLFQLKLDVFPLSEKLMTRHQNYLRSAAGKMPDQVRVASHALNPIAGLREVKAFPKDLRASHGFDNQANQLTLSPLLLDAFLRLSVSILESPDFNEANVGIWNDFFREPPAGQDLREEIARRLEPFLTLAFRRPVDHETRDRYVGYAATRLSQGKSFTECMKRVASAVLSSPRFLYRIPAVDESDEPFELASNLSFFLWGSCPDAELLRLAERRELSRPEQLNRTIDRLLADPKIERFLDAFPAQWLQLENVLAATPDPQKYRLFHLDESNPASLQMLLEPLLLFDAVFVEDRPIDEFITPKFTWRSDFLKTWYTSDLQPPAVDVAGIELENRRHDRRRTTLQSSIRTARTKLDALLQPVKDRLLAARKKETGDRQPVDLKPYAAWEFNGDLKSSVNSLDLKAHGKIEFQDGMVVLNRAYLISEKLPIDLQAKSLEVWCKVHDLNQRGGGVIGIQGPGDFFDTIVLGERKPRHWISGSNRFARTEDFADSTPETVANEMLHLAMVYAADGTTTLYRNGEAYGKPYRKAAATFPKDRTSLLFGLRHLPPGGNKYLHVTIDKARLYDRPLTAEEVAASASGSTLYITDEALHLALTDEQRSQRDALTETIARHESDLRSVPDRRDPNQVRQDVQRSFDQSIRTQLRSQVFERVAVSDPRYGGMITNAAMLSMTSGPKRTHPIARGAWIIEVIFNDPPPPPPNDVPPLNENQTDKNLTIREKFAMHRENPDCAGCHSRLDPLGFALENFDITGRWRSKYENGRDVDASGTLLRKYDYTGIVDFKASILKEKKRFAKAFAGHLLRFATSRELNPADSLAIDTIVGRAERDGFKLKSLIREVVLSDSF